MDMNMNVALWIIQIILGIKMITVTYTHGLRQSQPTMQEAIQKMGMFSKLWLNLAAFSTFIGTLGLILPGVLGVSSWITPVTAGVLSIILVFSLVTHIRAREQPKVFVSIILFGLAAFVAYGRWVLVPLSG